MESKRHINVLIVLANPFTTGRLHLDDEIRQIKQALERGKYRRYISIEVIQAATTRDLRRSLLEKTYHIVHISGHGTKEGLIFSDEQGGQSIVDVSALADLLKSWPSIECILLNSCYSIYQGRLLSSSVPFTIAMEGLLNDSVAISFSVGFYDALVAGFPTDFAYNQGIHAIKTEISPNVLHPILLKKGVSYVEVDEQIKTDSTIEVFERTYVRAGKFLVGFAIDLSGSMHQSIGNTSDMEISRLNSLDQSLNDLIIHTHKSLQESRNRDIEPSLDLFAYGFGLRSIAVCDLLTLIKAAREVINDDLINAYKEKEQQRSREKFQGYSGFGALLRGAGFGGLVSAGERLAKDLVKDRIIKQIIRDTRSQIETRMGEIGDTTLPFEDITSLWNASKLNLDHLDDILFGNTPIEDVFQALVGRFEREIQQRGNNIQSVLFFISDGKFTIDPLPFTQKLQSMGVHIISCFVSNQDIANPRVLLNAPDPQWGADAQIMFNMSSPMGELLEVRRYLFEHSWKIHPQPRLFVQVNHSDILKEFMRVTVSLLEDSDAAHALEKGW